MKVLSTMLRIDYNAATNMNNFFKVISFVELQHLGALDCSDRDILAALTKVVSVRPLKKTLLGSKHQAINFFLHVSLFSLINM